MPPVIVNIPPVEGSPGWLAPLIGFIGVLIGVLGTNLLAQVRERRAFHRDKRLELYLDLQNEEYEVRHWLGKLGREPVVPDWIAVNGRWSSLMLRLDLFASPEVRKKARDFYFEGKRFMRDATEASRRPTRQLSSGVSSKKTEELAAQARIALDTFGELWDLMREDLGVKGYSAEDRGVAG